MNSAQQAAKNGAITRQEIGLAEAHEHFWRERGDEIDVLRVYARTLRSWPKTIAISVILVAAMTGVISKFFLTKWYKATVIIRPVSQGAIQEQLEGLMSGFGGGSAAGIGGMLASVSGSSGDADEYVSIIKSFTFSRALIGHHDLMKDFMPAQPPSLKEFDSSRHLQWLAYRELQSRLTCEYSVRTGNITLEFQDTDPGRAEVILGYVIDDFRELLRQKQVHDAKAAVDSLEEQARRTSDVLLQSELYQLIANQVQRGKVAEVQSDFAFTIIEAPSASDIKVWPRTRLLCLLAALATFAIIAVYILFIRSELVSTAAPLLLDQPAKRHEPPVLADATKHQAS
jgi:uncharacterized protein involved in exopolysaccharide biosynthesis